MSFRVGQTVVHPHHGAAVVDQFEDRMRNGDTERYVVMTLSEGDLTLKVPTELCEDVGIRQVMDTDGVDEVVEVLGGEPETSNSHWSRRLKANQRRLRSGNPAEIAQVVRDLTAKEQRKGLSPAEKRLRDKGRSMLRGELAAAIDGDAEAADKLIDESLQLELAVD